MMISEFPMIQTLVESLSPTVVNVSVEARFGLGDTLLDPAMAVGWRPQFLISLRLTKCLHDTAAGFPQSKGEIMVLLGSSL